MNFTGSYATFAEEVGYKFGNDLHILRNGQRVQVAK
jgi:hypothetical protein